MGLISHQIWLCTIFYVDRAVKIILKNWTKSPPNSKAIKTSLIYSTESQKVYADQGTSCLHHKQNYTCPSKITFILYNSLLFVYLLFVVTHFTVVSFSLAFCLSSILTPCIFFSNILLCLYLISHPCRVES